MWEKFFLNRLERCCIPLMYIKYIHYTIYIYISIYILYIFMRVCVCVYSRTTVDGMMIIIVKPNVIYMTHQLIARKRIQEEEKRKHTTSRKRKYNLWDLENAAGYCSSTAQHSALYVNWNNIWIWQHSFGRRLCVIESPRIHFSFGFFLTFSTEESLLLIRLAAAKRSTESAGVAVLACRYSDVDRRSSRRTI